MTVTAPVAIPTMPHHERAAPKTVTIISGGPNSSPNAFHVNFFGNGKEIPSWEDRKHGRAILDSKLGVRPLVEQWIDRMGKYAGLSMVGDTPPLVNTWMNKNVHSMIVATAVA